MDFNDLSIVEEKVPIDGSVYTLREASGDAAVNYRNALFSCAKFGPDGKPVSMMGMANIEPLLVSLCLFDGNDKAVPEKVIRSWPARVQKALFNRAKEISELDEAEDEERIKNGSEDMTDGSD